MENEQHKVPHVELDNPTIRRAQSYIRMVGTGDLLACILVGPAGMGKTHLVRETLDEMGVDHVVYGGHISLAETYEFLFENSDRLIFFDDVSQMITQPEIMELLKQALNTSGYLRTLNYRSKGVLSEKVPKKFVFEGRCIFAFNAVDKNNPNVKAILDRAPTIEICFSRQELEKAMMDIANGEGGILREREKKLVTQEIIDYTTSDMDVSLRKQQLAFKIYNSFKKLYGDQELWRDQVRQIFGKKKVSWMVELVTELVGQGKIGRQELVREIAIRKEISPRSAQRRIQEFLEIDEIYTNKLKGGDISVKKFN